MKKEKLFRETAFGGYKREDVLNYIEASDRSHREAMEEKEERILELNESLSKANLHNEALEKELEIKTGFAREAEDLRRQLQEKDKQIEDLIASSQQLAKQTEEIVRQCEDLTAEVEKSRNGFACERLSGGTCSAVSEQAKKILDEAEATAKQKISAAEEQASGILLKARIEAQSMITEAEGQTEALARQVSDEAHEIITMTVKEAKEIIGIAKAQSDEILTDSARSIGKIKGNLSSMQMVVKNIENELRSAKESLSENITKKEE